MRRYLWDDRVIDRQEARETVQALLDSAVERGYGLWMLWPRGGSDPLGFCALREIAGTADVEIIYGLARDACGNGLATEASRAVLAYGFEVIGLPRIWGRTDPPNAASLAVIERLGMRPADNPGEDTRPIVAFVLDRPM